MFWDISLAYTMQNITFSLCISAIFLPCWCYSPTYFPHNGKFNWGRACAARVGISRIRQGRTPKCLSELDGLPFKCIVATKKYACFSSLFHSFSLTLFLHPDIFKPNFCNNYGQCGQKHSCCCTLTKHVLFFCLNINQLIVRSTKLILKTWHIHIRYTKC